MANQTEELLIRMGFDASAEQRGTEAMVIRQKAAAQAIADIWKVQNAEIVRMEAATLAEKAALEVKANEASFARLEAFRARQAELNAVAMEEQSAQALIGQGSVPENMAEGAMVGGLAGKGIREVGHEAHGFAGILRESAVLVREGMRGNFTRMVGSFTLLAGMISAMAIPILAGVAAIVGLPAYHAYRAHKDAQENVKQEEEKAKRAAETLRENVRLGEKYKVISKEQAAGVTNQLDAGTTEGVLAAMDQLRDLGVTQQIHVLKAREEHERALAEAMKDRAESEKALAEQADRTLTMNREYQDLINNKNKIQSESNRIDQESPSQEDLAGSNFTSQLDKDYGARKYNKRGQMIAGRFSLSAGDGPFAGIAQDAELAKKQQMWDIIHGNAQFADKDDADGRWKAGDLIGGQAFEDKKRQIADENKLTQAGLQTPAMKQDEMRQHMADISSKIGELLKKAEGEGINIAVPNS